MPQLVQGIGVLAFAVITISLWLSRGFQFDSKKPLERFSSPIIALELAETVDDVKKIVGDKGDLNRQIVRSSLKLDFLFIAAYWLLFLAMSLLLSQRGYSWAISLGVFAGICATAAAGFDVFENLRILKLLDLSLAETDDHMAGAICQASLVKWGLIFGAMALLAPTFMWRSDWVVFIGVLYVLTAAAGLIGLIYRPVIEWAVILLGLGMPWVAFLFTFWPEKFLDGF